MKRAGGRAAGDLRELGLQTSVLSRADGSAKFSSGPVQVLASVNGPLEVRLRDEIVDRAHLEVNVRPAKGLPGPATKSLCDSLSSVLIPILLLNRHPRSLIQLSLQTLSLPTTKFSKPFRTFSEDRADDDGSSAIERESVSEKAACINAAVLALVDAAVGMKGMVAAVAVALLPSQDDSDEMETSAHSNVVLDPTAEEERDSLATLCVAFSFGKGQGETVGDVCFLELSSGSCEEEELMRAVEAARSAAQSILAFFRKAQEAKYLPA